MNRHPLLRAYMAGVLVPSWFVLAAVTVLFGILRVQLESPAVFERLIIFGMAVIPNLWGLWNVMYAGFGLKRKLPLGVWGALLPLLIAPMGLAMLHHVDLEVVGFTDILMVAPVGIGAYFLVWKFVVSFLNRVVGLD